MKDLDFFRPGSWGGTLEGVITKFGAKLTVGDMSANTLLKVAVLIVGGIIMLYRHPEFFSDLKGLSSTFDR